MARDTKSSTTAFVATRTKLNDELPGGRTAFIPGADNNRINVLYSRFKSKH